MSMAVQEKYNLYIDECGDHYLATYDRNFPIFTLLLNRTLSS